MNKKRLLQVRDRILNERLPVVMATWFSIRTKDKKNWPRASKLDGIPYYGIDLEDMKKLPTKKGIAQNGCGTAGCIGGHAIMEFLGNARRNTLLEYCIGKDAEGKLWINPWDVAQRILELDIYESNKLFYFSNWPQRFQNDYAKHIRSRRYMKANKVTAARIDHFIETGE